MTPSPTGEGYTVCGRGERIGVCAQTGGIPYLICTPGLPRQANACHPFPGKGLETVCGRGAGRRGRRPLRIDRHFVRQQTVFRVLYARRAPTASYLGTSLPEGG